MSFHPVGLLILILTSYVISPAVIIVPDANWREAALIWLSINMPTVSTKSSLYDYLNNVLQQVRRKSGCTASHPPWLLDDAMYEKMGDKMAKNGGRLLGLYDELTTFLTQLNLYRGKGSSLTHEMAVFLQLYNGHSWTHATSNTII